ncbi:MAG: hypothetical protein JOZ16_04615 [Methylobacteriaceae bacterium]|nr:hypothetical protein [Methylobacteriaceae bacterium]
MSGAGFGRLNRTKRDVTTFLRFVAHGLREDIRNGRSFDFLSSEIKAKTLRLKAEKVRRRFDALNTPDYRGEFSPAILGDVDVLSLCHAAQVAEQKLCILSFLRHVGTPRRWTIVSDGSLTASHAASLRALYPSVVDLALWTDFICDENRECVREFSKYTKFAKKLALESNLPFDRATIYIDSDVVFFEGGHQLRNLLANLQGRSFYQQDLPGLYDPLIVTAEETKLPPVNAGFVILGKRFDWSEPLARLRNVLEGLTAAQGATDLEKLEQGTAHVAHVINSSVPLDGRYILQISDRFLDGDAYSGPASVMRHYVRPVRHKMWTHASQYVR